MTYYLILLVEFWRDQQVTIGERPIQLVDPHNDKNYVGFMPVFDNYDAALKFVDGKEHYIKEVETL